MRFLYSFLVPDLESAILQGESFLEKYLETIVWILEVLTATELVIVVLFSRLSQEIFTFSKDKVHHDLILVLVPQIQDYGVLFNLIFIFMPVTPSPTLKIPVLNNVNISIHLFIQINICLFPQYT